jgi:hypothetical protein
VLLAIHWHLLNSIRRRCYGIFFTQKPVANPVLKVGRK